MKKKEYNTINKILSGLTAALALVPEAFAFSLIANVSSLIGFYAAFIIGLIESLLTMTVIDEMTETRGHGNKECVTQGVANLSCGFFGGMGGCVMRSGGHYSLALFTPSARSSKY